MKKMKKIAIIFSILIFSCQGETPVDNTENQQIFTNNINNFKKSLEAFAVEDVDSFMEIFADSLKWTGPDKKLMNESDTKKDLQTALVGYTTLYDNHELRDAVYFGGNTYSSNGDPSDNPNTLRVYGNWHHTHTESGVDVTHKWMAVLWFNEDGKVHQFNDFFDVGGFLVQHEQ
jgi:ketosteroid isomerase-like protein